jgi:hypothetical protein
MADLDLVGPWLNLSALHNPALPLHLLADGTTARWWTRGVEWACKGILEQLGPALPPAAAAAAFEAWGTHLVAGKGDLPGEWERQVRRLRETTNPKDMGWRCSDLLGIGLMTVPYASVPPLALTIVRRLRALLPSAPADVDQALEVLSRYVPETSDAR